MPLTTINTTRDAIILTQAEHTRQTHKPIRKRLRKICATCKTTWGRYGCSIGLWATHVLSRMSKIVIPNPPPRPKHRHRPAYVKLVTQGAQHMQHLYTHPTPRY